MKILVIDDQILFRECLVKAIEGQSDFKVIGQTNSIEDGIELVVNLRPDIILLGIDSSQINGLEAIEKLIYYRPETRIVILSNNKSDESLFSAIRHGAKGFIPKDIPLEHLLASLRALERDGTALSRMMTSRIIQEFTRLGKLVNGEDHDGLEVLTAREMEVLELLGRDETNDEIARHLMISQNTVKVHISHILVKLALRNRHEAGRFARRHGITRRSRTSTST